MAETGGKETDLSLSTSHLSSRLDLVLLSKLSVLLEPLEGDLEERGSRFGGHLGPPLDRGSGRAAELHVEDLGREDGQTLRDGDARGRRCQSVRTKMRQGRDRDSRRRCECLETRTERWISKAAKHDDSGEAD